MLFALTIGLAVAGVLGLGVGAASYLRLRQWVAVCRGVRIAIAAKGRVQLDAPLIEWIEWANMLGSDERSRGRVIYHARGVSVAIAKPRRRPVAETKKVRAGIRERLRREPAEGTPA